MTGLGLIFTVLGVYGTNQLPFHIGWAYWTFALCVGFGAAAFVSPWVFQGPLAEASPFVQVPFAAALITLPITAVLLLIEGAVGGMQPIQNWPFLYATVYLVTICITTAMFFLETRRETAARAAALEEQLATAGAPSSAAERPGAGFLDKLPLKHRQADLYAVQSEDHYLRVHTSAGEAMILMRLSDAAALLSDIAGLQTHRSWWVAKDGVSEIRKDGQRMILVLKDGAEAPVSRANIARVRDAGWI